MYVLDSSAFIEIANSTKRAQSLHVLTGDAPLAVTTITVHELLLTNNEKERFIINGLLTGLQIVEHDELAARNGAAIETQLVKEGKKINRADIFIAAICKANNAHLITVDKDFAKIKGLQVTVL